MVYCCSYDHFDRGRSNCPMFRNEDYFAPRDEEPKEVASSATDDLDVLETALVSVCPRCGKVRIYYTIMGAKYMNSVTQTMEL